MATQETSSVIKVRQMTVCNKCFPRQSSVENQFRGNVTFPIISLTGKWLEAAGFEAGQVVDVACSDTRLVITLSKEQRFEEFKTICPPGDEAAEA